MDQNQERRRGHFPRGRRGPDRRGFDRRTPTSQAPDAGRNNVDVEQIMREIRARIAQRHGVELSVQQIQELAARRLEAILDARALKPALLEGMRRAAATPPEGSEASIEPAYSFDEQTVYASHRGVLRLIRRLLNPVLKLFFNPTPVARALATQARLNVEAARRDAERDRRQTEWNALHYEIVQRLVTEVSRVSLELQALSGQVESLSAKVDFNERRVRGIEGRALRAEEPAPAGRPAERAVQARPAARPAEAPAGEEPTTAAETAGEGGAAVQPVEGARRRRRRRRGRRGGGAPSEATVTGWTAAGIETLPSEPAAAESGPEFGGTEESIPPVTTEGDVLVESPDPQAAAPSEAEPVPAWEEPQEPRASLEPAPGPPDTDPREQ